MVVMVCGVCGTWWWWYVVVDHGDGMWWLLYMVVVHGGGGDFVCLFVLLLYVPSQQLWSLRDGQIT